MRYGSAASSEVATQTVEWCAPPSKVVRPAGAVHVWRAELDLEPVSLRRLGQNLSTDERVRAARFRFARDRERFVAARGLLREIVALYLNTAARQLRFGYSAHGKPFLAEVEHSNLRFNLSHSLGTMLVAVAYKRQVGVDVEHMRADLAVDEIAETVFSAQEKHALNCFDGEAKRIAFLRLWTRKEAYIKAGGWGMSLPPEHIDVSAPADRAAVLDEPVGRWRTCSRWTLQTLALSPDYAAALAAEGRDWQLACWQWPG